MVAISSGSLASATAAPTRLSACHAAPPSLQPFERKKSNANSSSSEEGVVDGVGEDVLLSSVPVSTPSSEEGVIDGVSEKEGAVDDGLSSVPSSSRSGSHIEYPPCEQQ